MLAVIGRNRAASRMASAQSRSTSTSPPDGSPSSVPMFDGWPLKYWPRVAIVESEVGPAFEVGFFARNGTGITRQPRNRYVLA